MTDPKTPLPPLRSHDALDEALRYEGKRMLRGSMQRMRSLMGERVRREASEAIRRRVTGIDAFARARTIALFFPIEQKHEVDVVGLDVAARSNGARVVYPALVDPVHGDEQDPEAPRRMVFRVVELRKGLDVEATRAALDASLREQGRGFSEPSEDAVEVTPAEIDLFIVPGLAFDPLGGRVGYGGGYYDRALVAAPSALAIGVAFDLQIVAEVPTTSRDVALHQVATERRLFDVVSSSRSSRR